MESSRTVSVDVRADLERGSATQAGNYVIDEINEEADEEDYFGSKLCNFEEKEMDFDKEVSSYDEGVDENDDCLDLR